VSLVRRGRAGKARWEIGESFATGTVTGTVLQTSCQPFSSSSRKRRGYLTGATRVPSGNQPQPTAT
jgi:hypothetical protein